MKTLLILNLCLGYFSAISQGIVAGDTSTPGIIYVDLDPNVYVEVPYPSGSNTYNLDIDNNGIADIKFTASWFQSMGMSSKDTHCTKLGPGDISFYPGNSDWVDEFNSGEIINSSNGWDNGGTLREYYSDPWNSYSGGIFSYGYIGFRFYINNLISYGWIKASAGTSHVSIYEYAYEGTLTGIDNYDLSTDFLLKPNPVKYLLFVDIPERNRNTEHSFFIVNIFGKKVIEGEISSSNQSIDCTELNAGYYFIYLTDGNRNYKPQKFVKY